MMPLASVLIDTYNHERFIEEAIVSVLEQDFPRSEMEILVVDDGSTDRTPEILHKFASGVRLLRKENGGQASAFNAAIPEARGEIVAFLDGDDWWAKNKLRRVAETMAGDPSLGIVGHGIVVVQQDGREQTETLRDGFRFRANAIAGARLFRVRRSFLGTSRMSIRAGLLRTIGRIPESIAIEADEYLFTLAAVLAPAQILPEALTYYRLHDANLYQMSTTDPERIRRKQKVIEILFQSLSDELERYGVPEEVRRILVGIVRAEADQLRLSLGEGWPWETVQTEWFIYRTLHPDSSFPHRIFKVLSLLPALTIPPGAFYQIRSKVAGSGFYLRARKRLLPMPDTYREGSKGAALRCLTKLQNSA
jgi:glycosyltransferase involved in cell wall biosynthesis